MRRQEQGGERVRAWRRRRREEWKLTEAVPALQPEGLARRRYLIRNKSGYKTVLGIQI